jgi:lipopolysaccharide transport system permease protein
LLRIALLPGLQEIEQEQEQKIVSGLVQDHEQVQVQEHVQEEKQAQIEESAQASSLPVTSGAAAAPSMLAQMLGIIAHRQVLSLLVSRDISSRHKGSLLGRLWPLIHPLGQLIIYTFVFSIILKVRFAGHADTGSFAIYFMAGLIPWTIFSESVSRSSTVILENPNLVTKVVFPTEVLPLVNVFSSFCTQFLATIVLFLCTVIYLPAHTLHPTVLLVPFLALPLLGLTAGVSLFLASLGVYVRDTKHVVSLALQAGMYATPILYPASAVPAAYSWVLQANPLAGIVTDFRKVLLDGQVPHLHDVAAYSLVSLVICLSGLYFFLKTKRSFADVM